MPETKTLPTFSFIPLPYPLGRHGRCSVNMDWLTDYCLGSTVPNTRMFRKHLMCSYVSSFHRDVPKTLKQGSAHSKVKCLSPEPTPAHCLQQRAGRSDATALQSRLPRRAAPDPVLNRPCSQQPGAAEYKGAGDSRGLAAYALTRCHCSLTITVTESALCQEERQSLRLLAEPGG